MSDKSEVLYMRDSSHESNDVSMAFNYLANEKTMLIKNKIPMFKYGCFLIPIMKTWGVPGKKVVGVFILSGILHQKSTIGRKSQAKEDQLLIGGISSAVRDLLGHLTTAFNLTYLDTYNLKLTASYNSIRRVCNIL
jgi:hypothetical protein